jgi:hypothetical protein
VERGGVIVAGRAEREEVLHVSGLAAKCLMNIDNS